MKEFVLNNIKILDSESTHNQKRKNIHIKNGQVVNIDSKTINVVTKTIECEGLHVSIGWFDMSAGLCEPGLEYKDTISHLSSSAAFGGFTELAVLPNTQPAVHSKESIRFIESFKEDLPIALHPIAAATVGNSGEAMAELTDLHRSGAIAFSDGTHPLSNHQIIQHILIYLKSFDGLLMNHPEDTAIARNGQMHEGITSTIMGMEGIPALSEQMAIQRDIALLHYTESRIHFSQISTKKSVELIRAAKKEGLNITCDIAAHQIAFTEEELGSFDTNLKVKPPFRTQEDIEAIWQGIADDTIDAIVSHHLPQDQESKQTAFDMASFGMLSLETAFAALNTYKPQYVSIEQLLKKITVTPRKILRQRLPKIKIKERANLTLFDLNTEWVFEQKHIQSLAKNTPFIGKKFRGRPIGIINGTKCVFNQSFLGSL